MARLEGLAEATATTTAKTGTDWSGIIGSAIPALVAARNQDKVMRLNMQREAQGLKPLDIENYQPGVKVGIDPNTRKLLMAVALITVLGFGGVMYASSRKKGKA